MKQKTMQLIFMMLAICMLCATQPISAKAVAPASDAQKTTAESSKTGSGARAGSSPRLTNPTLKVEGRNITAIKAEIGNLTGETVYCALYKGKRLINVSVATVQNGKVSCDIRDNGECDSIKLFALNSATAQPLTNVLEVTPVRQESGSNFTITKPGIYALGDYNDVIIDSSVGNGEVTLLSMEIGGDLLVQGGGANTVVLGNGLTVVGDVSVEKSGGGEAPRLLLNGAKLDVVTVKTEGTVVETTAPTTLKKLTAEKSTTIVGALTVNMVEATGNVSAEAQTNITHTVVQNGASLDFKGEAETVECPSGMTAVGVTVSNGNPVLTGGGKVAAVTIRGNAQAVVEVKSDAITVDRSAKGASVTVSGASGAIIVEDGAEAESVTVSVDTKVTVNGTATTVNATGTVAVQVEGTGTITELTAENTEKVSVSGGNLPTSAKKIDSVLTDIYVTNPNKCDYHIGEKLDIAGMMIFAKYNILFENKILGSYTAFIPVSTNMVSGFESITAGEKILKVTYNAKVANTNVYVRPEKGVTRLDICMQLYDVVENNQQMKALLPILDRYPMPFTDCTTLAPRERRAVAFCYGQRLMNPCGGDIFSPHSDCTRASAANVLQRTLHAIFGTNLPKPFPMPEYTDFTTDHWGWESAVEVVQAGLMSGVTVEGNLLFQPNIHMTVADMEKSLAALEDLLKTNVPGPTAVLENQNQQFMKPNTSVTLVVTAAPRSGGTLSYQWYSSNVGADLKEATPIQNETKSSMVVKNDGTMARWYFAIVTETLPDGRKGLTKCESCSMIQMYEAKLNISITQNDVPLVGTWVYCKSSGQNSWAKVDASGKAYFGWLPAGRYQIEIWVKNSNVPYNITGDTAGEIVANATAPRNLAIQVGDYNQALMPERPVITDVVINGTLLSVRGTNLEGSGRQIIWRQHNEPTANSSIIKEYRTSTLDLANLQLQPNSTQYIRVLARNQQKEYYSMNIGNTGCIEVKVDSLGAITARKYGSGTGTSEVG